jgi:prepilin-type N-terminal cleavage/methylation domain-containing protein
VAVESRYSLARADDGSTTHGFALGSDYNPRYPLIIGHSMKASRSGQSSNVRTGFTLVEVIVVLVLLTLAAAVVAPSLFRPHAEASELASLVRSARDAAVRRGETIHLRIDHSGAWQAMTEGSPPTELLMAGRLSDSRGAVDILFSPLGTCAPSPETLPAQALAAFDPLTCEAR